LPHDWHVPTMPPSGPSEKTIAPPHLRHGRARLAEGAFQSPPRRSNEGRSRRPNDGPSGPPPGRPRGEGRFSSFCSSSSSPSSPPASSALAVAAGPFGPLGDSGASARASLNTVSQSSHVAASRFSSSTESTSAPPHSAQAAVSSSSSSSAADSPSAPGGVSAPPGVTTLTSVASGIGGRTTKVFEHPGQVPAPIVTARGTTSTSLPQAGQWDGIHFLRREGAESGEVH
jgi:hypothetical protein